MLNIVIWKSYRFKEKEMRLAFIDTTGHTVVDTEDLCLAERLFNEALDNGKMAVKINPGRQREHLREFDQYADEIQFTGRMVGG